MNRDTAAGRAVVLLSDTAAYDAAVKRLLAQKPFLARIMKECLPEYKDSSIADIMNLYIEGDPHVASMGVDVDETNPRIQGCNSEDSTLTEGTVFYDIRFNALAPHKGGTIGIIINVEAQNRSNPGYSLLRRAIYYCSRMISAQKNVEFTGSNYDGIKKVYSIWVCSETSAGEESGITAYAMKEFPLIGNGRKPSEEYDLLSVVMIRLNEVPRYDDGRVNEAELDNNVIGMLEVLLKGNLTAAQRKQILEEHYGVEMTEQIGEEVGHMCNLGQGVMEKAMAQGMAQGIEKGMAQGVEKGLAQGVDKNRIESIRALMDSMGLSLEQAILALKYPMSEKDKYAAALN